MTENFELIHRMVGSFSNDDLRPFVVEGTVASREEADEMLSELVSTFDQNGRTKNGVWWGLNDNEPSTRHLFDRRHQL